MSKLKLNCQDLFDQVRPVMKTMQDNKMIDHTGAIYIEYDNKLSWPVGLGVECDESRQDNDVIDRIGLVYIETETELLGPIWSGVVYEEN